MKTRIYAAPAVKGLILTTLKYFCKNHGDQRFFLFEVITNVLASFSASFEYLWYGSTAVKNILILSVLGSILYVRIWRL